MIKMYIHQETITITHIYAPNNRATKCRKQKLQEMKGEIDNLKIIVGGFNTPLSTVFRTTGEKTNKETEDSNRTIKQLDTADVYEALYPTKGEYTFFSTSHKTFSSTGYAKA